jgi:hypothetical protein
MLVHLLVCAPILGKYRVRMKFLKNDAKASVYTVRLYALKQLQNYDLRPLDMHDLSYALQIPFPHKNTPDICPPRRLVRI